MNEKMVAIKKGNYLQKQKKFIVLFLFILMGATAFSQNSLVMQTIERAKTLRNDKKFAEAATVLGDFEKQYPGNIWIERLYAQTLFWMQDYQKSDEIYRRALQYHPNDMDLKYEYSLLLFSEKKYDPAKNLLTEYTNSPKDNGAAEGLLGKINFYQKDFKDAAAHLKKALRFNPGNKEFLDLYQQVYRIISPNIFLGGMLRSDTQPMNVYGPTAKFQWYQSNLLDFSISGNYLTFSNIPAQNSISFVQVSNLFRFAQQGLELKLFAGQNYSGLDKSHEWNGGASLIKSLGKSIKLQADAKRINYNYTESSVGNLLMINQYSLALIAGKQNDWNGMAGAQTQYYPDNNYVSALYVWALSRPLNISGVKLSLGYAFNYMDSKEDRFVAKSLYYQTHPMGNSSASTEGIYVPYYTPHKQFSNSLLANLSAPLSPVTRFHAHASVGFYSKTNAPYFVENNSIVVKEFGYQTYYPLDIGGSLFFDLSRQITFKINYNYQKTYYYSSHFLDLAFQFYL